jgi:glucose-1-phosphate thymidylyltransferase
MMVVLGDNIMFGSSLIENLKSAKQDMLSKQKSIIFSVPSSKPEEFGVLKYGEDDQPIDIVEKPTEFLSNDVVPGIYFYKYEHLRDLDKIKKSARGELEVSDFNRQLLYSKRVEVRFLGRGVTWLDCGSFQNLVDASLSVSLIQRHSNQNIGDVNEIDNLIGHNW